MSGTITWNRLLEDMLSLEYDVSSSRIAPGGFRTSVMSGMLRLGRTPSLAKEARQKKTPDNFLPLLNNNSIR